MKLLSNSDWQTTIRKFLPKGALLFVWLCCLLALWGWPKALHAAPTAAPFAQVDCFGIMNVSNTAELNNAISCYNSQTTAGVYTIIFSNDITLTTASTVIDNINPGVALQILGNRYTLSGANTYRGLEINPNTHVMIDDLFIRAGKADTNGGGILNNGTLTVSNSAVITNSTNNYGGGIYNAGQLTVSKSTLRGNSAEFGGGIFNNTNSTLIVSNSSLSSNKATNGGGGGIYNNVNAPLTMSNSTLSGNSANNGGGIASLSPLTVTNSTLSGNSSTIDGGGIYLLGSFAALTLNNAIIANSPSGGDCFSNAGTITSQTHNLIKDSANACGITNGANSSIIGQDPALAPLAFNDSSDLETHALLATSPAIDKGDPATCAAPPINNLDQNGGLRPIGAACDIGAVEYIACSFPATVSTTTELNDAITCYGMQNTAGVYTITFTSDITLTSETRSINNFNLGVALQINGNNKVLSGANTYRGFLIDGDAHLTITRLTIRDGKTSDDTGGGILNYGDLTLDNSQIISNSASTQDGGGIYNDGALTVTNSSIISNSAQSNSDGGGIYNAGRLTVGNSQIISNGAKNGGGIYNAGLLDMTNSTLNGNGAFNGSGLYNNDTSSVSNSTLSGNLVSYGIGGTIYNTGTLTVTNSTLAANISGLGGYSGLYQDSAGTLALRNTIIANNEVNDDCFNSGGTITSQTNNLIESSGTAACGIVNGANGSIIGQDPALAPLAFNGGSGPKTHALLIGSLAINKGDAATCAAPPINNRDQIGVSRPQGAACDIGALEYVPNRYTLTANKAGSGSGTVKSIPSGIDCGATCLALYDQGATVTLTATPSAGSTFVGWSGACSGAATCAVTVDSTKAVTATFNKAIVTNQTLTVSKAGSGSGTVSSSPTGINCGTTCNAPFAQNAVVTLTATPDAGSTFAGWGGACSGTTTTCTVTVDSAKTVTASFNKTTTTTATLTVSKAGSGSGAVTSSPAGINCGTTCNAPFAQNAAVTLTATADTGSTFAGWSGACSGTTATCTVTLDTAKTVTASFNKANGTGEVQKIYLPTASR